MRAGDPVCDDAEPRRVPRRRDRFEHLRLLRGDQVLEHLALHIRGQVEITKAGDEEGMEDQHDCLRGRRGEVVAVIVGQVVGVERRGREEDSATP